jgi:hypothetical protein
MFFLVNNLQAERLGYNALDYFLQFLYTVIKFAIEL